MHRSAQPHEAARDQQAPALAGIRVLDLTQFLAGPWATQILADLGADVIKIESPDGDLTRRLPPHFVGDDSVYFLCANRSKRSVVLDLKTAEGRDLLRRLALHCDIIIENFRPGVASRLGLDPDDIRAAKPALIWASISGFGQTGPYRDRPAYDMIVQALSGGMSLTGEPDGPSVRAGIPIADLSAGLYAAIGVLAALHRRSVSGDGETIDISMLDCQAAMTCYQSAYYLHSGSVPAHQGRGHDSIPTYRSFRCADDVELVVTANTERMWTSLCSVLDLTALAADPRFRTNQDRHDNRTELWPLLDDAFGARPAAAWSAALEAADIPAGTVNTLDRVAADPQILHRNMPLELVHADGRRATVMGNPIGLQEAGSPPSHFPPMLGENSEEVLRELLGLTSEECAALEAQAVIRSGQGTPTLAGSTA